MNTTNKLVIGMAGCAVFLMLAVFGFNLKIETKPEAANAAAGLINLPGLQSVIVYEQSAGPAAVPAKSWYWGPTNPQLITKISGGPSANAHDLSTGVEYYDLYVSNSDGTPNAGGDYLTIDVKMPSPQYNQNSGGNIDAVGLKFNNGEEIFASSVTNVIVGAGQTGMYSTTQGYKNLAVGAPDASGLNGVTFLGSGGSITLAFTLSNNNTGTVVCSTNADCGTSGYVGNNFCSGNAVYKNYKTYTCNNPGATNSYCSNSTAQQLQSTCAANQTCSNGACVNNQTGTIACSSNSECGSNGYVGSNFCNGNAVFQNYKTYTCNNAGTTNSYCSSNTASQQQTVCANNQTCSNGACVNNQTGNITCSSNADCGANGYTGSNFCSGNSVYQNYRTYTCNNAGTTSSYCSNSTNQQLQTTCASNQTCNNGNCNNVISQCTTHSYFRCDGNGVYWYNSCGAREELYQACTGNQICPAGSNVCVNQNINLGNLLVNVQVRNLSSGNLAWSTSVPATPADIVQYYVTVQTSNNSIANNIIVKDVLPANLYFYNNVMVDGVANSGNITTGINIGSLSYGQTRTITYQAQVASAGNFGFGTTTLYNAVSASSPNTFNTGTGSAAVTVTRSGVLGATTVSTGLTNNFWIDSFFLPLMLALLGVWAWKSGIFSNLAIAGWVNTKKERYAAIASQSKLESKIAEIKERENA